MVAITVVAGHALLELDMGQVGDQLRENSSADIHPPLFRRCWNAFLVRFSIQIVFSKKAAYTIDFKGFTDIRKVLYRTAVIPTLSKAEALTPRCCGTSSSGLVARRAMRNSLTGAAR